MKKVLISLFAITLTFSAFAQDSNSTTTNTVRKSEVDREEGVIMKNGQLLMMKDGQTTQLTTDLTLDNGAIVTAEGSVKNKDGTITTLKEGDYVAMDGTAGNISNWQQKNKAKKDSAR